MWSFGIRVTQRRGADRPAFVLGDSNRMLWFSRLVPRCQGSVSKGCRGSGDPKGYGQTGRRCCITLGSCAVWCRCAPRLGTVLRAPSRARYICTRRLELVECSVAASSRTRTSWRGCCRRLSRPPFKAAAGDDPWTLPKLPTKRIEVTGIQAIARNHVPIPTCLPFPRPSRHGVLPPPRSELL